MNFMQASASRREKCSSQDVGKIKGNHFGKHFEIYQKDSGLVERAINANFLSGNIAPNSQIVKSNFLFF